jgi:hypothetical protein
MLLKDLSKQYKFLKEFNKKDIFSELFNHSDELEIVVYRNSFKFKFVFDYWFKRSLMNKFIDYLNKYSHEAKLLSRLNFALGRVLFLEHRKDFEEEALRLVLLSQDEILKEVKSFNKVNKVYVLENFFNFFNGKAKYLAFINELNLILFKKASVTAFNLKKVILLNTLDEDQKARVIGFAA